MQPLEEGFASTWRFNRWKDVSLRQRGLLETHNEIFHDREFVKKGGYT
jgi:hypothetical protein